MARVLFHYQASPALARRLRALEQNGLTVEIVAPADAAALAMALPHTEVLWHVLEPVTAAVIAAAPRLRLIQKIGVGVNTIDLEAARSRGIAVCNMPGTNTPAVAELTLALMLACLRRLVKLDTAGRAGEGWGRPAAAGGGGGRPGRWTTSARSAVGPSASSATAPCRNGSPRCYGHSGPRWSTGP